MSENKAPQDSNTRDQKSFAKTSRFSIYSTLFKSECEICQRIKNVSLRETLEIQTKGARTNPFETPPMVQQQEPRKRVKQKSLQSS
jgi:hypothetical protein